MVLFRFVKMVVVFSSCVSGTNTPQVFVDLEEHDIGDHRRNSLKTPWSPSWRIEFASTSADIDRGKWPRCPPQDFLINLHYVFALQDSVLHDSKLCNQWLIPWPQQIGNPPFEILGRSKLRSSRLREGPFLSSCFKLEFHDGAVPCAGLGERISVCQSIRFIYHRAFNQNFLLGSRFTCHFEQRIK